jgi:ATP-binding cassette, subfamily B, bacterial PglK
VKSSAKNVEHGPSVSECFAMLNARDLAKVGIACLLQLVLSFLDVLIVTLIGVIVSIGSFAGEFRASKYVSTLLDILKLSDSSLATQVFTVGIIAAVTVIIKSALSLYVLRKITYFLSKKSSEITRDLLSKFLANSLIESQDKALQESLWSLTTGVSNITQGVIARSMTMVIDFTSFGSILVGLFFLDRIVALSSIAIFGILSTTLYLFFRQKARWVGKLETTLSIQSNQSLFQVLGSFRETFVRGRGEYYAETIGKTRLELSNTQANLNFMKVYSKYVMDISITIGALVVSVIEFGLIGGVNAVSSLGLFLAAGARLAPAVLRLQQNSLDVKSALAGAEPTLLMYKKLVSKPKSVPSVPFLDSEYNSFIPKVKFKDVTFSYKGANSPTLYEINLEIAAGEYCAIIGKSGAGKTTLVDILLGMNLPSSGSVSISEVTPAQAISSWPGAIGYVPQDVQVSEGSILDNVILGYEAGTVPEKLVWDALETAQLSEFVKSLPLGLNAQVGDRGTKLSGGQRQRLGIARAIVTKPRLLILDEATSSLDLKTESEFTEALNALKGKITLVVITHRLETIKSAQNVYQLKDGKLKKYDGGH